MTGVVPAPFSLATVRVCANTQGFPQDSGGLWGIAHQFTHQCGAAAGSGVATPRFATSIFAFIVDRCGEAAHAFVGLEISGRRLASVKTGAFRYFGCGRP